MRHRKHSKRSTRRYRGAEWDIPFGSGLFAVMGVGGFFVFVVIMMAL